MIFGKNFPAPAEAESELQSGKEYGMMAEECNQGRKR